MKGDYIYEEECEKAYERSLVLCSSKVGWIWSISDEEKARLALDRVTEKQTAKYPNSMKRWYDNWDAIIPIFKFSPDVRKVIYTTNAIESLNSTLP